MIDAGLTGKVVLVTGAAGGIGAAISRAFAAQGARLAVHYLGPQRAAPEHARWAHHTPTEQQARELAAELGGVALPADLAEPDAPSTLLAAVRAEFGKLDVLVNNAAHCASPDTVDELDAAGLQRHYLVNAVAPALLIKEFAAAAPQGGCVVNISTDAARAFPGQLGYGSSKAALEALTRACALDLGGRGIRVNAIAPGPVQTGWMDEQLLAQATAVVPLGRVGSPEDIADGVVFLASHQARWITGQVLQVAGGHAL